MAISTMANWLNVVAPDTTTVMSIGAAIVLEESNKTQQIRFGDDGSEERVSFTTAEKTVFYITLSFQNLSESDAGTIMDFYQDEQKGNGIIGTFVWQNNAETALTSYTVRFAEHLKRSTKGPLLFDLSNVRLKVLGLPA